MSQFTSLLQREREAYFLSKGSKLLSPYINSTTRIKFACTEEGCQDTNETTWATHSGRGANPELRCKAHNSPKRKSQKEREEYFLSKGSKLLSKWEGQDSKLIFKCSKPGCEELGDICWGNHIKKNSNPNLLCWDHLMGSVGKVHITKEVLDSELAPFNSKTLSEYQGWFKPLTVTCSECQSPVITTLSTWRQQKSKGNRPLCQTHKNLNRPRGESNSNYKGSLAQTQEI